MPESLRYAFDSNYAANMAFNDLVVLIGGLRVPRTVLALLTGVALGGAGALIQGHTRNPLADPHILGINAGAALAVVIAVYAGVGTEPGNLVLPAIIGCAITAGLVFLISSFGPVAMNPMALILAGVALAALFMGLVNALVLNNSLSLDALRAWSTGSVGDVIWVSYVPYSGLSLLVQFCAFSKGEDSTFSAWGNPSLRHSDCQ